VALSQLVREQTTCRRQRLTPFIFLYGLSVSNFEGANFEGQTPSRERYAHQYPDALSKGPNVMPTREAIILEVESRILFSNLWHGYDGRLDS
jgi:hypothetical protein